MSSFLQNLSLEKKDASSKISASLPWQGKSSILKRAHHRASRLKEIQMAKINNVEVLITLLTSGTHKISQPQGARVSHQKWKMNNGDLKYKICALCKIPAFYSVDLNFPFTFWVIGDGGAQPTPAWNRSDVIRIRNVFGVTSHLIGL
jgi:hypothetical protein